jgi:hypothetical protein
MIHETISQIEAKLQNAGALNPEARLELLNLLATLKGEIIKIDAEKAQSIAGFAQTLAHEATREEKNPELLKLSLAGLSASVDGFEKSHPKLVEIVNRICTALSGLGI